MKALSALMSCIAVACAMTSFTALSQTFPSKPIRVVVPFPPGGVDTWIRLMQKPMSDDLGQPIVIDNRPGAGGAIGAAHVARSAPDGYTVLATPVGLVTGAVISTVPFEPLKDFTPITAIFTSVIVLAAKPSLLVNSLEELIENAKRNPGKITYASTGIGSESHLAGEVLKMAARVDLNHVPYKGFGPALQAILAGEVDLAFVTLQTIRPLLNSGKAKPIAVYGIGKRHPSMPNVADISETVPSFRTTPSWIGLFGPAGLSQPVLARLNAAAVKALNSPPVRSRFDEVGAIVVANTAEEFAAMIKADFETAVKVVKSLKARGVQFE